MRTIPLAGIAALLLLAPVAEAKQVAGVEVCGVNGCRPVERRATLEGLMAWGGDRVKAPRATPFYRVLFELADGDGAPVPGYVLFYVPQAGAVLQEAPLGNTPWFHVGRAGRALRRATMGHEPYPGEFLPRFLENEKLRVADAKRRLWRARGERLAREPRTTASSDLTPVAMLGAAGLLLLLIGAGLARRLRRRRAGA